MLDSTVYRSAVSLLPEATAILLNTMGTRIGGRYERYRPLDTTARLAYGPALIAMFMLLVMSSAPAQAAQAVNEGASGGAVLLAAILVVGGPALVGWGAHWSISGYVWIRDASIPRSATVKVVRRHWAGRVTTFKKANTASIAVPLIDECKPRNGTIRLVGGDGMYFMGGRRGRLREAMHTWIVDRGMKIEYLLMCPHSEFAEGVKEFSETLGDRSHMLSVFLIPDIDDMPDDDMKRLANFLVTYHPNLVSWPNDDESPNRAMWLEGKHLPRESVSHDNRWVPPKAMSDPVSRDVGNSAMTWSDFFASWDEALDDLKLRMTRHA